jgi:hypothetical protein
MCVGVEGSNKCTILRAMEHGPGEAEGRSWSSGETVNDDGMRRLGVASVDAVAEDVSGEVGKIVGGIHLGDDAPPEALMGDAAQSPEAVPGSAMLLARVVSSSLSESSESCVR